MVSISNSPCHGSDQNLMNLKHPLFISCLHSVSFVKEVSCSCYFLCVCCQTWIKLTNGPTDERRNASRIFLVHLYFIQWNHLFYFLSQWTTINFQSALHTHTHSTRTHARIYIKILFSFPFCWFARKRIKQCVIACYFKNKWMTNGNGVIFTTVFFSCSHPVHLFVACLVNCIRLIGLRCIFFCHRWNVMILAQRKKNKFK